MSSDKTFFERGSLSNIKGFKDLNLFDDFIQTALDKYSYTQEIPKLDESAVKFQDYILNEESQIPDLIIYNKPFNKNECFSGYYNHGFNKYPRKKFVLNAKDKKENENNENIEKQNEETKIEKEDNEIKEDKSKKVKNEENKASIENNENKIENETKKNENITEEKKEEENKMKEKPKKKDKKKKRKR